MIDIRHVRDIARARKSTRIHMLYADYIYMNLTKQITMTIQAEDFEHVSFCTFIC